MVGFICSTFASHLDHKLAPSEVENLLKRKWSYTWKMPALDMSNCNWRGTGASSFQVILAFLVKLQWIDVTSTESYLSRNSLHMYLIVQFSYCSLLVQCLIAVDIPTAIICSFEFLLLQIVMLQTK